MPKQVQTQILRKSGDNDLAYLKKLDLFVFEKDKEPTKMESGDITKEHFSESSLNLWKYRGNLGGKKLSEIMVDLTNGDSDFAGFLFKKSDELKGYVIFVMEDDKVVVKHLCLTTVESNSDVYERTGLNKVLTDKSWKNLFNGVYLTRMVLRQHKILIPTQLPKTSKLQITFCCS